MRKYVYIVPVVVAVLFLHVCCEIPGMTVIPDDIPDQYYVDIDDIHIRNTSTLSGVRFGYGHSSISYFTYLAPSPQPGTPVDTTISLYAYSNLCWQVQRVIDCLVIDSGTISLSSDKWLLIEGDSSGWSCTWSNGGWD